MPNLAWEQTSFQGIHTQPGKVEGGHLFAEDMQNLRIDGDGWLQLRADAIGLDPVGYNIIGIATTPSHVFVLRGTDLPDGVSAQYNRDLRITRTYEADIDPLFGFGVDETETHVVMGVTEENIIIGRQTDSEDFTDLAADTEIEVVQGDTTIRCRIVERDGINDESVTYEIKILSGDPDDLIDGSDVEIVLVGTTEWADERGSDSTRIRFGGSGNGMPFPENPVLYVREIADLETEIEIEGIDDFDGRISVVNFNTYVILTSEGADQGYIIDLREGENYQAYPLGFSEPGPSSYTVGLVNEIPSNLNSKFYNRFNREAELSENTYYHYLYTIVSLPDDRESPWYGMESNPPQNELVDTLIEGIENISEARGLVYSGVNSFNLFQFRENESFVKLTLNFVKPLPATHLRIYRSNPIENAIIDLSITEAARQRTIKQLFSNLDYRLVLETEISQVSGVLDFFDGISDEDWAEGQLLETTNDRMPAEVKQIHNFNDLIFGAAGDRLVYSDLRQGALVPWSFPTLNEIRVQGSVDFCAEINEVLLFGSRDGLWRLAGNTEYNFAVGQISNSGAVDGYAWSRITDALAFVGEGGLFVTDASRVIRVSETVLDDFFQDKKVVRGAVAFFKDGDILYAVTLEDGDGNTEDVQFKREDGYWVRWNLPFMQSASIIEA